MAKAMGARVFATAGSDEKCKVCETLGAEMAINYHHQDFVTELKAATNKRGIDVILDMIGGDYLSKNFALAAMDGRIINIAYLKGFVTEANFMPIMLKRLTVTGSTLRPQSAEIKAKIAQNLLTQIWPKIENGEIKPVIAQTFPLAQVADAHKLMESNKHIGKIVLTLGDKH
jgi:NADPH:quinone reductase-like Zn-dependent oxidoreductase